MTCGFNSPADKRWLVLRFGAPVELIVWQLRRATTYKCAQNRDHCWTGGGGHPFLLTAIEATLSLRRCRSVLEQEPELWLRRSSAREDKRRDSCQSFACSAGCMYVRGGGFFRVEHKQCPEVGSFAVTALFKTQNGCNFKDSFIFQL